MFVNCTLSSSSSKVCSGEMESVNHLKIQIDVYRLKKEVCTSAESLIDAMFTSE